MSYRDDNDAAVARADALEVDLERVRAERDRLQAEVDGGKLARTTMSAHELDVLVARLEASIATQTGRVIGGGTVLVASLILFSISGANAAAVTCSLAGAVGLVLAIAAPGRSAAREVIAAVRDAPEQITAIREIGRPRSWTGARTVLVRTATTRAMFRTDAPDSLLVALAARCPNATLR